MNVISRVSAVLPSGCLLIVALAVSSVFATEVFWVGGPEGNWNDPLNWSSGIVPNSSSVNVTLDNDPLQATTVTLASTFNTGRFVLDEGDRLDIANAGLTAVTAILAGDVDIAPSARLTLGQSLWVQPSGSITLNDAPVVVGATLQGQTDVISFWNQGRVTGAGNIGERLAIVNEGTITANAAGETLIWTLHPFTPPFSPPSPHRNGGELLAESGGTLIIRGGELQNWTDGSIGAIQAHGDSTVRLEGVQVSGGVLSTSSLGGENEGMIQLMNQPTLRDVKLEGNVKFGPVWFEGVIENNTVLTSESQLAGAINIKSATTLTGNGRLELNQRTMLGSTSSPTFPPNYLVNDVEHTIAGPGNISAGSFTLVNRGLIESDHPGGWLAVGGGVATNTGVIRAHNGGVISLSGWHWDNFEGEEAGLIEAGVNSIVSLSPTSHLILRGGTLRALAAEGESGDEPGKVVAQTLYSTTLADIRLEGEIGDVNSSWNISGTIENTGTLLTSGVRISDSAVLTGGGKVRVASGISTSQLLPRTLVNQDNVIVGYGLIQTQYLSITNRGAILADHDSIPLTLSGSTGNLVNCGTLRATDGASLRIHQLVNNYEGTQDGTIVADDASEVETASVTGGVLATTGTGKIIVSTGARLTDVHNQGRLEAGGSLEIRNTMRNDGVIVSNSTSSLNLLGPATSLTGTGLVKSEEHPLNVRVGPAQGLPTILLHGEEHTISGHGNLIVQRGTLINRGTIAASDDEPLVVQLSTAATMVQEGNLLAPSSQLLEIQTNEQRFTNHGTIDVAGTFHAKRVNQGPLEFVNAAGGEILVDGDFHLANYVGSGPVTLWNQPGALIAGGGTIELVTGASQHTPLLRNSGVIRSQLELDSHGQLVLSGNFLQDSMGILQLTLGDEPSSGWFDSLHLTDGDATLGGTLEISIAEGFEPTVGDSFEIITTGGNLLGTFESLIAPTLDGRWWTVDYQSDRVLLAVAAASAATPGDFNGDGFVDGDDLIEWQAAFGLTADADADGDGVSDGHDFLAWQRQFGSGVASAAAVPEPSGIAMLWFGLLTASASRLGGRRRSDRSTD